MSVSNLLKKNDLELFAEKLTVNNLVPQGDINISGANGDILYINNNQLNKLPIGAQDEVLKVSAGGVPEWGAGGGGSGTATELATSDAQVIPLTNTKPAPLSPDQFLGYNQVNGQAIWKQVPPAPASELNTATIGSVLIASNDPVNFGDVLAYTGANVASWSAQRGTAFQLEASSIPPVSINTNDPLVNDDVLSYDGNSVATWKGAVAKGFANGTGGSFPIIASFPAPQNNEVLKYLAGTNQAVWGPTPLPDNVDLQGTLSVGNSNPATKFSLPNALPDAGTGPNASKQNQFLVVEDELGNLGWRQSPYLYSSSLFSSSVSINGTFQSINCPVDPSGLNGRLTVPANSFLSAQSYKLLMRGRATFAQNENLELRIGATNPSLVFTNFATVAFQCAQAISSRIFEIDAEFRVNSPSNPANQFFSCYIKFEYLEGTTQRTFKFLNLFQLDTTVDQSLTIDIRSAETTPAAGQSMQTEIQVIDKLF